MGVFFLKKYISWFYYMAVLGKNIKQKSCIMQIGYGPSGPAPETSLVASVIHANRY